MGVLMDGVSNYSLKEDPTYEDALKVFNKLDFDDRANLVPRHPDFLREVPDDMLFDRQVAVDGDGNPVGFQEFYLHKDKRGRRLPPHNIVAVVPDARGNGLARLMVEATVRKARKEKIKRLVWEAFADNEPSIRAAMSAGFKDATPKNAKGHRRLVYDVSEKNAHTGKVPWLESRRNAELVKKAYKLGYQAGLCSPRAQLKKQASDKEEKPISELKDGVYSGRRYGYTFELNTGEKYKTSTGTRCTRAWWPSWGATFSTRSQCACGPCTMRV